MRRAATYIGQGRRRPRYMWVLFDMVNGHPGGHQYLWWFETREAAREHRRRQNSFPSSARLAGPFRYRCES